MSKVPFTFVFIREDTGELDSTFERIEGGILQAFDHAETIPNVKVGSVVHCIRTDSTRAAHGTVARKVAT